MQSKLIMDNNKTKLGQNDSRILLTTSKQWTKKDHSALREEWQFADKNCAKTPNFALELVALDLSSICAVSARLNTPDCE